MTHPEPTPEQPTAYNYDYDKIAEIDRLYEQMCDWYDQQKEANLASWGVENLDEIDHDW